MSLTKQECEKSLEILNKEASRLCNDIECENCCYETDNIFECKLDKYIKNLEQLINEHFDNPPLKFEELEDMLFKPIWCNKNKKWFLLREIIIRYSGLNELELIDMNGIGYLVDFEENRFYKYEVKHND